MFQKHNTTLFSTVAISAAVLFASLFTMSFVHQVLAQSSNKSGNATAAGGNATASGNATTTTGTAGAANPVPSTTNSAPSSGY